MTDDTDSYAEGRQAYYTNVPFKDVPEGANREKWVQGWLDAKDFESYRRYYEEGD